MYTYIIYTYVYIYIYIISIICYVEVGTVVLYMLSKPVQGLTCLDFL